MQRCDLFSSIGPVVITASCSFPPLGFKFTFAAGGREEGDAVPLGSMGDMEG